MTTPFAHCPACLHDRTASTGQPLRLTCPNCHHRWQAPESAAKTNYETLAGRNPAEHPHVARKMAERCDAIGRLVQDGQRIIEIGCAEGTLGERIKRARRVTYDGLEISADAVIAEARLDRVLRQAANTAPAGVYDWVLAFHVLEHIADIDAEIAAWCRLLAPGGKMLLEVPNGSGHPLVGDDRHPEHLHQFSAASLAILLARHGLDVHHLSTGHFESPAYPDCIRILAAPAVLQAQREARWLKRLHQHFTAPFYIHGIGGDFRNYLLPVLEEIPVRALVDRSHGQSYAGRTVHSPATMCDDDAPILVSSLRFAPEIVSDLVRCGIAPQRIVTLAELLADA